MSVAELFDALGDGSASPYGPAPEADGEARAWLDRHQNRFGAFIGGDWREIGSQTFAVTAPASGNTLATVSNSGEAAVDAAVDAARKAQAEWAALPGHARARHLYALARTIQRNARLLAVVEAMDNGKPIRETRDIDIPLAARHFYHHAGWAQLQETEFAGYRPYGVVGQIIPWNFPLLMLAWKVAPALALGNTVVLKPAEQTPLTALLFAELARDAGLPPGVLNVVPGLGETGALIAGHDGIDKVAFTGSTDVGRLIREATAGSGKGLTLELGGKSPFIVFDDADIDGAVEGVVDAIWFNQGEVCCAGSRLLVQEGVADTFRSALLARMETLRVGDPLDKSVDMGAMVSRADAERVTALVARGVEDGATLHQPSWADRMEGAYLPPTLLTDVSTADHVAREEIFGPVAVMMTFRTPDEAVQLANNSRYGLAASVWSETIGQALDLAPRLEAGIVWVNATNLMDAGAPFGGVRESGYGREGGVEGAYEYLKPVAWDDAGTPTPSRTSDVPKAMPVQVDRTPKLYIGGKQKRPDGGYSRPVAGRSGAGLGEVAEANRKDVRDAVEAARKASGWSAATPHLRAQVLYYLAENLAARRDEIAARLDAQIETDGALEVDLAVRRLFTYAAWSDKYDGRVQVPPLGHPGLALALTEPVGVVGVLAPSEAPLLGLVSLAAPLIAMGNRVVLVASEAAPLVAQDLYQTLDTSDVPAGVLNILTGNHAALAATMGDHLDIDAVWCFGPAAEAVERASSGNMKRTFTGLKKRIDWFDDAAEGRPFLREATRVKTVWIPYGA